MTPAEAIAALAALEETAQAITSSLDAECRRRHLAWRGGGKPSGWDSEEYIDLKKARQTAQRVCAMLRNHRR